MNFQKGYVKKIFVGIIILLLFILIVMTSGMNREASIIESKAGGVVVPVQGFFKNISQSLSDTLHTIGSISYIKKENEELRKKIAFLEEENRITKEVISKSEFLHKEYDLLKNSDMEYVKADVVGKNPGNWFNYFTINEGKSSGIKLNDMVVLPVQFDDKLVIDGLVGRIIEVGDNWSKIIGIIDYGSSISFKVLRTQDHGILSGSLEENINGYMFDSTADIVIGDKLMTSGIGGVFKEGIYIGEITNITKSDDQLIKNIEIESNVDFKKINEILVITE